MYMIFDQVVSKANQVKGQRQIKSKVVLKANHQNMRLKMNTLEYSGTLLMRPPLGHKILVVITRWSH